MHFTAELSNMNHTYGRQVDEMFRFSSNFRSERGSVVGGKRVTEDFDSLASVHAGNGLHQMRGRMITEIRGNVTDT